LVGLEISTLAFLAARKQNTNKTKKTKESEKRAFGTQFNAVSQKVEC
jgi:hypothetical protein